VRQGLIDPLLAVIGRSKCDSAVEYTRDSTQRIFCNASAEGSGHDYVRSADI
jgi:hypothetical protein